MTQGSISLSKTCSDPAGQLCLNLELGVIQSHLHEGWSQPCPNPVAREQRQWLGLGQGQRASEGGGAAEGGDQLSREREGEGGAAAW